jgi:UDP-glucose 4-epimerase
MSQRILITGGAGYIGSHITTLIDSDNEVLIVDNLSNSSRYNLEQLEQVLGKKLYIAIIDIMDQKSLVEVMMEFKPHIILHLAGCRNIQEGLIDPAYFWDINYIGTKNILIAMVIADCPRIIYFSSAQVYGYNYNTPLTETSRLNPIDILGESKLACEELITSYAHKYNITADILRLANVVGAHPNGQLGEYIETSPKLLPSIFRSIIKNTPLILYSHNKQHTNYRDYIHVMDVAKACSLLINLPNPASLKTDTKTNINIYNLSFGYKYNHLDIVNLVQQITNQTIQITFLQPTNPQIQSIELINQKIQTHLNWLPQTTIEQAIIDQWNWLNNKLTITSNLELQITKEPQQAL